MSFIYDSTSLNFPKTDLSPLPPGANAAQYVVATDWNLANQALIDTRDAIRAGKYFGFTTQATDPAPTTHTNTWLWVRTSDGQLIHRRPDGTSREIVDKSSHLLPSANNTYNIGSSGTKWANLFVTQMSINTINDALGGGAIDIATAGEFSIVARNLLPSVTASKDLGSNSKKWNNGYFVTALVNGLSVTLGVTDNYIDVGAGSTTAVGAASRGRIRYNQSTNKLQVSLNTAAYVDLATGSPGYNLIQGNATPVAVQTTLNFSSAFTVVDDNPNNRTNVGFAGTLPSLTLDTGSLVIDGAGTVRHVEMGAGSTSAVSGASKGRIRYNESTQRFQVSHSGAAYVDLTTGAAGVQLSDSPAWTGSHYWNSGSTQADVATIGVTPRVTDGVLGSHYLKFEGSSRDSGVNHVANWRQWVDVTNGPGASTLVFQSRIDVAAYADRMRITDGGFLTINTLLTTARVGAGNSSPAVALHVGDATNPGQMLLDSGSGNTAYGEWKNGASAAVSAAGAGRIRYNTSTQKFQMSENGAAYADVFNFLVRVSATDTTPTDGIFGKLQSGSAVSIVKLNAGGDEKIQISAAASNFGVTGEKVTSVLRVGDSESHDSATPKVICQFSFNPTEYSMTNTTRTISFRAVAANSDTGLTTHVELYNLTDGESITILNFTSTTPTLVSASLTVGAGAGQVDNSAKTYEVRIYVDAPDGINDSIELGSAEVAVTNTIN